MIWVPQAQRNCMHCWIELCRKKSMGKQGTCGPASERAGVWKGKERTGLGGYNKEYSRMDVARKRESGWGYDEEV